MRVRGQGWGGGSAMPDVCILHKMENIHEKSCLLSPKIHELFEQLGNYVTVIIQQVGDGAW